MYRIMALICSAVISATSILGAAFVPTFPLVPPTDVQIFGLINNVYGITAISESNEVDKLEAYWNMYRAIMGSAFDTFQVQMQEVLNGAKTSRKIEIPATLNQTINVALKNAIENSIPIGQGTPNATTPQQWVQRCEQHGLHMTLEQATELKNSIGYNYLGANNEPYTLAIAVTVDGTVLILPYYVGVNVYFYDAGSWTEIRYGNGQNRALYYRYGINLSNMTLTRYNGSTEGIMAFNAYPGMQFTLIGQGRTTTITAMNQNVNTSIMSEEQIPITSDTQVVNGEIDPTDSVVVNLPNVIPYPAIDPQQIAEVLRELGVVPSSETQDVTETVQQLKEEAQEKYGDANDYALDLTRYFPFCLPFDVARILQAFVAEPEAPSFAYTINNPFSDDPEDDIVLEIDLAQFNDVAAILRTLESIAFVVGLAVVTRSLYLRG